MPIYEFRCADCGAVYDRLCKSASDVGAVCPSCGSDNQRRLISTFAVSRSLTPCGSTTSDAARSCGIGAGDEVCGTCCRRP